MRPPRLVVPVVTAIALTAIALAASAGGLHAQAEQARKVAAGGVAAGWAGTVDPRAAASGASVADARLEKQGDALHVTTGPAVTYWKKGESLTGDYTVSATFTEPKYMNLNDHPHPYGIVVAGNDMGSKDETYLYCAAYGNGSFIVRGFGPAPFQMNGRGESNAAVHKAAGKGEPVTQAIAVSVHDGNVDCSINGSVVASYPRSQVVGSGKLKSTDGAYGIRFAHNTEGTVTDLKVVKK